MCMVGIRLVGIFQLEYLNLNTYFIGRLCDDIFCGASIPNEETFIGRRHSFGLVRIMCGEQHLWVQPSEWRHYFLGTHVWTLFAEAIFQYLLVVHNLTNWRHIVVTV